MADLPSNPNVLTTPREFSPSHYIQQEEYFDAAKEPEASGVVSVKPANTGSAYDKLAVDIVAIYAGDGSVFEFKPSKPSTAQKLIRVSLSKPEDPRSSVAQSTASPQPNRTTGRSSGVSDGTQSRTVNWLRDNNMICSHVPYIARIIGFGLNLTALDKFLTTNANPQTLRLESFSQEIGRQLQRDRKNHGSRPVVFIGHGYGTLLIEKLLLSSDLPEKEPNPGLLDEVPSVGLTPLSEYLRKSTAAVGLFSPPFSVKPLMNWSQSLGLSAKAVIFTRLPIQPVPTNKLWKDFNVHIAEWNTSTFAFRKREEGGKGKAQVREKNEAAAPNQENETSKPQFTEDSLADEVWGKDGDINDIARFSGPKDERFRTMTDFLTRAIHTHHLLAAAERGDAKMIKELDNRFIDINLPNRRGETSLHVAVRFENLDALRALIRTDKVLLNQKDESGKTALDIAARRNNPSDYTLVKELLLAGARPNLKASSNFESGPETPTAVTPSQVSSRALKVLLQNPPSLSPPRPISRLIKQTPADGTDARVACQKTEVLVVEMFSTGSYFPYYTNIERLIYASDGVHDEKADSNTAEAQDPRGKEPDEQRLESGNQGPREKGLKATLDEYFLKKLREESHQENSSLDGIPTVCRWHHVPMNNMAWVHDLFASLDYQVWPWPQGYRNFSFPFSRAVYPQAAELKPLCEKVDVHGSRVFAVMMPYISYQESLQQSAVSALIRKHGISTEEINEEDWIKLDSSRRPRSWWRRSLRSEKWLWKVTGVSYRNSDFRSHWRRRMERKRAAESERIIKGGTCDAIKGYLNYKHTSGYALPLHPRRTLDQSYYYMLSDTSIRDKTQVVSRWFLRRKGRKARPGYLYIGDPDPRSQKAHNILMVDQLWLWVVQTPEQPDTIITSFPNREGATFTAVDDLQMHILHDSIHSTAELVGKILAACCQTLSPNQDIESLTFLQIFENSIAQAEEDASNLFHEFRFLSYMQGLIQKHRRILLGELLDIGKESKLWMEVKDILDETKIIQTTLEDQIAVLESSEMRKFDSLFFGGIDFGWKARDMLHRATRTFSILKARAEAVEKSIEHLLGRKQMQANLWEARTSREGADATAKQGDTLLLFTIVTIVFLPLSFMASFFALAIDKFPKNEDGNTSWPLNYVCGLIFGISFAVSIPLIFFAFAIGVLKNGWNRFRHFWGKILILPALHLLSRLPSELGYIGNKCWKTVNASAASYDKWEDRVRQLIPGNDDEYNEGFDDDMMHFFGHRIKRFIDAGRLGVTPEDLDDSAESENEPEF